MSGAHDVRVLGRGPIQGRVVARGAHDEIGAAPFVVVRDAGGTEHYARLQAGMMSPELNRDIELFSAGRHAVLRELGRQADLGL